MDWSSTVRKLERAVARDPRSRLFLPLAEAYRELGRFRKAAELLQEGIRLYPGYLRARVGLARTLLLLERLEEARQELHEVLSLAPGNVLARRLLADLYRGEGLNGHAAAEYRSLLRYEPGADHIAEELARLTAAPDPAPAAAPRHDPGASADDPPVQSASRPANGAQGAQATTEETQVNDTRSTALFKPGIGVASALRAGFADAPAGDGGSAQHERQFDEFFSLPPVPPSAAELGPERFLLEFFPGTFGGELPEPPPAAALEAEVAAVAPAIQTMALAQLYIDQGFVAEAREMLEQVVADDPSNIEAWEKLETLRSGDRTGSPEDVLKRWLDAIQAVKQSRGLALVA